MDPSDPHSFPPPHPAPPRTTRREFLSAASAGAASLLLSSSVEALAQSASATGSSGKADFTLDISETEWEIASGKKVHTSTYNGLVPGPLIRLTEGKPVTIDIINHLDRPEIVHWHGQWIPPAVDGSMEEGTPLIPPGARTRVEFTPRPSGFHWYHTHIHAHTDFRRGLYTGLLGPLFVDSAQNPGQYDQEHFLVLHEFDPYIAPSDDGSEQIDYRYGAVNGRMLGHADPIQVREGQRVLLHILNASATQLHWLNLPGHQFQIVSLDGRPVPTPRAVETLRLGPAERITAVVTMNQPGVWVLGESREDVRQTGMGIVIEYAGQTGKPVDREPGALAWDYRIFGNPSATVAKPDATVPLVFTSKFEGHGAMDRWLINGKSFPDTPEIPLKQGLRHRLVFTNHSVDDHPVHLHRHAFELVSVNGRPTSGVFKDTVVVVSGTTVEADLVADNPGLTLFHCHQQDHMDMGFMMLFRYA